MGNLWLAISFYVVLNSLFNEQDISYFSWQEQFYGNDMENLLDCMDSKQTKISSMLNFDKVHKNDAKSV
jgi:hypothetical protein